MSEKKKTESIINKKISRRSLLKWSAGLAVAGAVGVGLGYEANQLLRPITTVAEQPAAFTEEKRYIQETQFSTRYVYVSNGRIIRTDTIIHPADVGYPHFKVGDKMFKPPLKVINGPPAIGYRDNVYAANRVQYPMKRVGFTPGPQTADSVANRGKGEFVRITWDEALDILAKELKRMVEVYGPGAITDGSK